MNPITIKDVLEKTTRFFSDKGIESSRLDAELLISSALNWERMKIYLNYQYPLNETELTSCRDLVRRRAGGEPVAYILGKKGFYNHDFVVTPDVLIPRPETEMIVDDATAWLRPQATQFIVDIGCGSGCIGLSLLAELPDARLLAVDISEGAIAVAKLNAEQIGVTDRATFLCRDAAGLTPEEVSAVFSAPADAVVANPPYIAPGDPLVQPGVKNFEPGLALFSEDRGLSHIRGWARVAARVARPGAFVMFEMGHDQALSAREIFAMDYSDVIIKRDLAGHDRYVRAFVGVTNG